MSEPIHERPHLRDRRDDWADATEEEWVDALGSQPRPVDPMFMNYAERCRPEALCRYLRLHEQMGGFLGPPARRLLRKHRR